MFSPLMQDLLESPLSPYYGRNLPWSTLETCPLFRNRFPRAQDSKSTQNKFQVLLNVKHFTPDEISVKTVDNFVVVHGKHDEHADEHGFVSREFTRRYRLPEDVEVEKVSSALSKDGVLTIEAPRKVPELPRNERLVPIKIQRPAAFERYQSMQELQQQPEAQEIQEPQQQQASADDEEK